ncbi:hypothetical protein ATKI12_3359 [Kitasatospora sp. Ki12]
MSLASNAGSSRFNPLPSRLSLVPLISFFSFCSFAPRSGPGPAVRSAPVRSGPGGPAQLAAISRSESPRITRSWASPRLVLDFTVPGLWRRAAAVASTDWSSQNRSTSAAR